MRVADGGGSGQFNLGAIEAAAEAAARAAAEAAARAAAAAAAKAAAAQAAHAAKAHSGRLHHAGHAEHGDLPWGNAAKAAVGTVAGSGAYELVKNSLSVHKKVTHLMSLSDKIAKAKAAASHDLQAVGNEIKKVSGIGDAAVGAGEVAHEAAHESQGLGRLGRFTSGVRVISGLNSAADLPNAIASLAHGPNLQNTTRAAGDVLGAVRGADEAVKFVKNSPVGFLGEKMNPVLSIAGDAVDATSRIDNMAHNWGKMSTTDKISNVANVAGDVADGVGSALEMAPPPADVAGIALKGVGAGLALVGMAAQYAPQIGHAAGVAEHAVAHAASDVGHAVGNAAKDVGHAISHIFSGW